MPKLNGDILYLIFKELQYNKNAIFSCLMVNKTWCEMIIPILWKDPWKYLKGKELKEPLFNVIISHLSDESRNNLKNQGINILTNVYQKPSFNYISFCKYLNLEILNELISAINNLKNTDLFLSVRKEIINLFINENTRITHLYVPCQFDYQLHLVSGAKNCFSELEFLSCSTYIKDDILFGLTEICKSIKELELFIEKDNNNYEIVKLIESSKKLFNVHLLTKYPENVIITSFCKILENSFIKHADTIQDFTITKEPITRILSSFVNLYKLELGKFSFRTRSWKCLENLSLPFLQILKTGGVPVKVLTNLIKNTNGYLVEINISRIFHNEIDNEKIIQAIYQKCPNLKYLKLVVRNCNILEFEKLLINCQYLNGLYIILCNYKNFGTDALFNWNLLFKVLVESSPTNLFRFKFHFIETPKLESLKLFLDNWKGKHPLLLQTSQLADELSDYIIFDKTSIYFDLIEEYKIQGIVKKHSHNNLMWQRFTFEDFEWIQENI
ncbi:hypothetical protein RclHR1_03760004 [Rhizophagus clarus]|uniref:F-box domain-containing protein n=1 Tax=Rhizophagus clarus TaxID=94130 RepID=A0A2Z6RT10_9GLOM|nr:hypothetical protein RclHR1_03760004 [Rhizophagus clarus]GES79940.1 hypothetical protein GLOIN_2v1784962 [Rhizophagus clarus]